jgi:hypothetical protein
LRSGAIPLAVGARGLCPQQFYVAIPLAVEIISLANNFFNKLFLAYLHRFCHAFFKSGFATLFSKAVLPSFF